MCVCVGRCVAGEGANASIGHRFFFKLTVIMGKGNMGSILKLSSFIYLFIEEKDRHKDEMLFLFIDMNRDNLDSWD